MSGYKMNLPGMGLDLFGALLGWHQTNLANQRADELLAGARDRHGQRANYIANNFATELPYNVSYAPEGGFDNGQLDQLAAQGIAAPGGAVNLFGPGGTGVPTFDLAELFDVGQSQLDAFRGLSPGLKGAFTASNQALSRGMNQFDTILGAASRNLGAGYTDSVLDQMAAQGLATSDIPTMENRLNQATSGILGNAYNDITGLVEGGRVSQAGLLEGVDLMDTDLSDVLSGKLAGASSAAQKKLGFQEQQQAANLLSGAGSLEQAGTRLQGLGFSSANDLATTARQLRGETELQELQAQQFNAGLQSQASNLAAQLNNALTQSQIGAREAFGTTAAELTSAHGIAQQNALNELLGITGTAGAGFADVQNAIDLNSSNLQKELLDAEVGLVGSAEQDQIQAFQALNQIFGNQQGLAQTAFNAQLASDAQLDQLLAGELGFNIYDPANIFDSNFMYEQSQPSGIL